MKRLKEKYNTEIIKTMQKEFKHSNCFEVPKITKISINVGIAKDKFSNELLNRVANDLYKITGQKPKICRAKKSISGFKLTQGDVNGLNITLRGKRMYEFLEKFLNVSLPRVRDFRGLSKKCFDKNFNYTTGIKENIIFPEISYDKIENIYGMQITFCTNAKELNETISLFRHLGFPLKGSK